MVKFSKIKIIAEAFDALLDEELLNANTNIIEYPVIDSEQIFKKYFEGTFPINTGEKKHEFPDAIALLSVEAWCSKNKTECIIFSKDKDFLKAKPEKGVTVNADYEDYLECIVNTIV